MDYDNFGGGGNGESARNLKVMTYATIEGTLTGVGVSESEFGQCSVNPTRMSFS